MAYKLGKNKEISHTEPLPKIERNSYKSEPRIIDYEDQPKRQEPIRREEPVRPPVEPIDYYEEPAPEKKKKTGGLTFLKVLFTLILIALAAVPVGFSMLPKLETVEIPKDPEQIGIIKEEEVNLTEEEKVVYEEKKQDVMNILLIGVDGEGYKGVRSDVMIVMTINKKTKQIHLTSMQRDTMAYLPLKKTYEKLNHAFAYDGALGTLTTINQNYDLNITEFVVFDYKALTKMVDAVGGVVLNVDKAEYNAMKAGGIPVAGTGQQKLNGKQALYFARIRKGAGDDPGRNTRQRDILKYVFSEAKKMSLGQLKNLADEIMPAVQTSYSYGDVLPMLEFFQTIKDGSELVDHSFPFEKKSAMLGGVYYEIPVTVASNITKLHEIVSDFQNYTPSDRAMEYHQTIGKKSGYFK